MKSQEISSVIGFAVCLGIGVAGIWYMIDLVRQENRAAVVKRLESNKVGPLDEAMAKMVGVTDRRKRSQKVILPTNQTPFKFDLRQSR